MTFKVLAWLLNNFDMFIEFCAAKKLLGQQT